MAFNRYIEVQAGPDGQEGVKISESHIRFKVKKTTQSSMNTAEVELFNLNEHSINIAKTVGNKIIVSAGYLDEGISDLFFGSITHSEINKPDQDRVLKIEAQDGQKAITQRYIRISFGARTPMPSITSQIFTRLALPVIGRDRIPADVIYQNGYTFIGMAKDALTQVLARAGLHWTIQNEQLFILGSGENAQTTGYLLSPNTGLISIEPLDKKEKTTARSKPKYKIQSLLYGGLIPGSKIEVQSSIFSGYASIIESEFVGENQSAGDFKAEIEVQSL